MKLFCLESISRYRLECGKIEVAVCRPMVSCVAVRLGRVGCVEVVGCKARYRLECGKIEVAVCRHMVCCLAVRLGRVGCVEIIGCKSNYRLGF